MKKIDFNKFSYFNEIELISLDEDLIEFDDRDIDFFEEFLDTSRDIKIGAIDYIIEHLQYYISNIKKIKNLKFYNLMIFS